MEQPFKTDPAKYIANVAPPEAQGDIANRLRLLADELEAGAVLITDTYASVNMLDTTPEGQEWQTVAQDRTSYVLLLRFMRPDTPAQESGLVTLEQYLRAAVEREVVDHTLRAERREDGTVAFYIHPMNVDGDTRDFEVRGNLLRRDPRVTVVPAEG